VVINRAGADDREDFTAGGPRHDLVLDLIGNHTLARIRRALAPGGRLVLSAGPPAPSIRRTLAVPARCGRWWSGPTRWPRRPRRCRQGDEHARGKTVITR
jgi:NADPH:quinone reductase-like Zn-dependent oxidoreductase